MTNSSAPESDPLLELVRRPSLEDELMMEKQIIEIKETEDIEYLRCYAQAITRENFHQSHFIATCLERLAGLQARIICLNNPVTKSSNVWWKKVLGL
tara:strand:+ start:270 stop:560 length:291 start_codon:yes stop_codon:yes gene_type:complete